MLWTVWLLYKVHSESLGLAKGSASTETSPQRLFQPNFCPWGLLCTWDIFCSKALLQVFKLHLGTGGSFTCRVIPAWMGFPGKVLAGLEIFVVALFQLGARWQWQKWACLWCLYKFWWKLFIVESCKVCFCHRIKGGYLAVTYAYIYMDPVEGDELQGGWVQCVWCFKYCLIVHKCRVEWAGRRTEEL